MNDIINFSTVSAVTVLSMGLALLIEVGLLKVVFSCLARVKTEPCAAVVAIAQGRDDRSRT
jgi:uncharacterized membrane protein